VADTCLVEGELVDLIDEFSDGRVQFAFAKVKDPNTGLQKYVLVGWCGEGVPERTKGYFTSHLAAVSKVLQVGIVLEIAQSIAHVFSRGIMFRLQPGQIAISLQRASYKRCRTHLALGTLQVPLPHHPVHHPHCRQNLPLHQHAVVEEAPDTILWGHQDKEQANREMVMLMRMDGARMRRQSHGHSSKKCHHPINQPKSISKS